jgi:hypothetical protein
MIPSNLTDDILRYMHIVNHVKEFVIGIVPLTEISDVTVVIEGYAFLKNSSGSSYKLHELGGILKHILREIGVTKIYIVPPSKWKKDLNIGVRGNKWAAFDFASKVVDIDLFVLLNMSEKRGREVPNPIQDIADGICLIEWRRKNSK